MIPFNTCMESYCSMVFLVGAFTQVKKPTLVVTFFQDYQELSTHKFSLLQGRASNQKHQKVPSTKVFGTVRQKMLKIRDTHPTYA